MIPPVVASERGRAQTGVVATPPRGCRTAIRQEGCDRNQMEIWTTDGESPVREAPRSPADILSNAEHEEFCANRPGPSGKAKYSCETDSEPVP